MLNNFTMINYFKKIYIYIYNILEFKIMLKYIYIFLMFLLTVLYKINYFDVNPLVK